MHPCLTLSNIRYVSRVKRSNPGKGVTPSSTPRYSSYWKGSLLVVLDYGHQLYFNLRINFLFIADFLSSSWYFFFFFFFLPRPRIGMMSLVTVFPVITAFHSCCLSHHVFDQVNLWPAWVGFETAIFWQCSPGTVEKNHLKKARGEIWPKRSERRNNTKKPTKMRTKSQQ